MIRHIVLLNLKADHQPTELGDVMAGLAALVGKIPGFAGFEHGPNRDLEQKTPDYPYGFVCTFDDVGALSLYADHPEHKMLGARLVALCKGGADGILVMDLDT